MHWDDIRYFLAVAREGSVARAAKFLGVNYTTVTRRIETFEKRLNVRLFSRLAAGYVMTAAAEAVFEEAVAMEDRALAFDRGLFGQDSRLSGRLRIASSDAVATRLLIPYLQQFQELHPGIQLEVATSDSIVSLDLRDADVAVRLSAAPPDHLIGQKTVEATYSVFASQEYLREHKALNSPMTRVLTWIADDHQPTWWPREFPQAIQGSKFDSPIALLTAIQAGLGIGALPDFLVNDADNVTAINQGQIDSGWRLWILSHPDTRTTMRLRAFREFVGQILTAQRALIGRM